MADAAGIYTNLTGGPITVVSHNNLGTASRNSQGNYSFTFGSALANANYVINATSKTAGAAVAIVSYTSRSTTGFGLMCFDHAGGTVDPGELMVEVNLI